MGVRYSVLTQFRSSPAQMSFDFGVTAKKRGVEPTVIHSHLNFEFLQASSRRAD
jgi:hypothetical protein